MWAVWESVQVSSRCLTLEAKELAHVIGRFARPLRSTGRGYLESSSGGFGLTLGALTFESAAAGGRPRGRAPTVLCWTISTGPRTWVPDNARRTGQPGQLCRQSARNVVTHSHNSDQLSDSTATSYAVRPAPSLPPNLSVDKRQRVLPKASPACSVQ